MTTATRNLTSSRDMLQWQYKSLLGELQQIELHAESGDCPCIMGDLDPAEYCLAKHTLNVHTLAFETANMDIANHKALRELADEAIEKHEGVKTFVCHKGELPELSSWARKWRKKHIERIYYTCRLKGNMHQETTGYHRLAVAILGQGAESTIGQPAAVRVEIERLREQVRTMHEGAPGRLRDLFDLMPAAIKRVLVTPDGYAAIVLDRYRREALTVIDDAQKEMVRHRTSRIDPWVPTYRPALERIIDRLEDYLLSNPTDRAVMGRVAVDPRQISMDKWLEEAIQAPEGASVPVLTPAPAPQPAGDLQTGRKLREGADALQKTIDAKYHPAIADQRPTARRARIAGGMYEEARALETVQKVMRGLAEAHENGTLPDALRGFKNRTQIDEVVHRRHFPAPCIGKWRLQDMYQHTADVPEAVPLKAILDAAKARDPNSEYCTRLTEDEMRVTEQLLALSLQHGNEDPWTPQDFAQYKRLAAIGIKTEEQFQTVKKLMLDYMREPIAVPKDVQRRELEAKLIGLRIPGFFPTPHDLAERMVILADIRAGMDVLEPSAGSGNIADAVKAGCPTCPLTLVELSQTLLEILRAKGYNPVAADFLNYAKDQGAGVFDRVLMNPPFEHGQDVDHVLHAYKLLKPGGRLVAIMGEHAFFAEDKKSEAFRLWLDEANGGTSERLPAGTFGHEVVSTDVNARLVVVDKVGAGLEQPRGMTKVQWQEALKAQLPMDFDRPPAVAVAPTCPPVCPSAPAVGPRATPEPVPTKKFELFDFQKEGVAWLKGKSRALLGDDMGLGKTPQAIHWGADHLPALVIVPAALLWNWHREITTMWRPGDTAVVLDGKNQVPRPLPDWTILTYGMLDRYLKQLKQAGFKCVIIDEAHLVKNLEAQRTKNLLDLVDPLKPSELDRPIPNRLAVTGTPILNRPIELFALLVFLGYKRREDLQDFLKRYTENKYIKGRLVFTGAKNLHELHASLKDIMIRRLKKDVLKNLPPKIHTPMFVPISNAEEYREAERNFLSWLRETQGTDAARNAARAETLARLNALRMLAAKGKVAPVCDWLKPCYQGQGKVIIFSSFSEPLEALKRCSGDAVIYDGSVPKQTRQEIVDNFQKTKAPCHFLGTIGAAGVGITLTASNRVAFLDLPWTPGAKQQAEDRAYRIGQTKTVEIVNVLARGTIDERMLKLLADKEFIIAQAVDGKRQDEARGESISGALMDDFMRHPVLSGLMQYEPEAKDKPVDLITEDDLRNLQGDMRQEPQVTISGKCKGKESCSLKVKASESVEAVASIGSLTKSIEEVLKKIEETHAPAPSAITFAIGSTTLTRYEFQNKLVEASDLLASHDPINFEPTPNYPAELQPRLRGRQANRSQVQNIAKNLDPDALLSDFHSIDRGAPIVGPDNVVESGNGRVMAIQLAVSQFPEVYARYRDELIARASVSGVSPEEAQKMRAPVLVRVRLTDVPRRQFVEEANASTTLAPSAIEVARADASHLTLEMVQQLWVGDEQGIEDALRSLSNGQFVSAFLATIPANQRAQITDSRGQLNQDGIRRMVMALFVNAFPGESGLKLAEKFFESTEPSVRNVFNGIAQALGKLAKSEALCRTNGRDPALAIGEDLAAAVVVFSDIKKTPGMTVANYLNQAQMFERRLTPFQERLLKILDDRARSGKRIGQLLKGYADVVMETPPPAQGALLPGAQLTKDQALDAAIKRGEAEEQATRLFQARPKLPGTYCSALSTAAKTLQAATRSLQTYRTNLVKAEKKLETARNICRGQSVMFQQAEMATRLPPKRLRVEPNEYWQSKKIDCPFVELVQHYQRSKWESASYWQRCTLTEKTCLLEKPADSRLCPVRQGAELKDQPKVAAVGPPPRKGKAPIIKISGKCGDKAESCTFTLKRQEPRIKAKSVDEALAAIEKLSRPCACGQSK